MKRTFFVIIDALTSRVVKPAMERGELPTFQMLADAGVCRDDCLSVFPSITPAATASLVTGEYPSNTRIAGAAWFDRRQNEFAYHGDDVWAIWNLGITEYFHGFLTKMNFERLRCDTLYEIANKHDLTAACFNLMWFRGPHRHSMQKPWLLDLITKGEMPSEIMGPDKLFLGDFVHAIADEDEITIDDAGLSNQYGFHDEKTSEALLKAIRADALADINVLYFPTNDFRSHEVGPSESLSVVKDVDRTLGKAIDELGGLENFLRSNSIFITGDHSHSVTAALPERAIEIDGLLPDLQIAPAGQPFGDGDDLLIGPNMRAANIYCRDAAGQRRLVIDCLLGDSRVDQLIWSDADALHVETAERGTLKFWLDQNGTPDQFGGRWCWEGNLQTVDGRVVDGKLEFRDYPNAFERLANGVNTHSGDLWATSFPGFEFKRPSTETHEGGSHGSLHRDDSVAPLIAAGLERSSVPEICRIVDIVPLIATELELDWSGPQAGETRQFDPTRDERGSSTS